MLQTSMTGWEQWSTMNWASDWNLTKLPNGIYIKQNQSKRMRLQKFFFEIQADHQNLAGGSS